jgi:hypothetical protein
VTARARLRAALADPIDRARAELPHVILEPADDPRLVAGLLLAWAAFQYFRAHGAPYQAAMEEWQLLARHHAVVLGRLLARQLTLANVSDDRDDCDLYRVMFSQSADGAVPRTLIPFRTRRT